MRRLLSTCSASFTFVGFVRTWFVNASSLELDTCSKTTNANKPAQLRFRQGQTDQNIDAKKSGLSMFCAYLHTVSLKKKTLADDAV